MGGVDPEVRYSETYGRASVSFESESPAGARPDDSRVDGAPEAKPDAPVQPDSEAIPDSPNNEVAASATTTRPDRNVTLGSDD